MSAILMWGLASVLASSFTVCALLVLTQRWHGKLSLDHDLHGAQKLHRTPVPRIGGLGLLFGLAIAVVAGYQSGGMTYPTTMLLLLCAMPVFIAGFAEDLTKKVRVRTRLLASFLSAAIAIWLLNARLLNLDTIVLDALISHPLFSIAFTIFAVGGVTHSINIIDGLNGLAAGAVSIMLTGLAAIAWLHGDLMVMKLCLWGVAAMVGFLLLNYPFGHIFLGDGGAYLAGFWMAECGVLLLMRNPQVSAWTVLLSCFYPVWETIFSMYRRRMIRRVNSGQPDMEHLHQLIYRHFQQNTTASPYIQAWLQHGVSSVAIWVLVFACQVIAISMNDNLVALLGGVAGFAGGYCCLYRAMTYSPRHFSESAQA